MDAVALKRVTRRHLRLVYVLGQELNLGRTAAKLNTSQPAVSAALRELEELLDLPLFTRTTRKVEMTQSGRVLWTHSQKIIVELEAAQRALTAGQSGEARELHVGVISAVPASLLARALADVRARGGGFPVRIQEGPASVLAERLAAGQLDAIICHLSTGIVDPHLHADILYEEKMCLTVAPSHSLGKRKKISWPDLQVQTWVLPSQDTRIRPRIEGELMIRGAPASGAIIEAGSVAIVLALLQELKAVAPMHERLAKSYERQGLLRILDYEFTVSHGQFAFLHVRSPRRHYGIELLRDSLRATLKLPSNHIASAGRAVNDASPESMTRRRPLDSTA